MNYTEKLKEIENALPKYLKNLKEGVFDHKAYIYLKGLFVEIIEDNGPVKPELIEISKLLNEFKEETLNSCLAPDPIVCEIQASL